MRVHELALQRWCNTHFFVREGYPVPVVFSKPMDAFGHFTEIWKSGENPFQYLLDIKDEKGTPLYEPYPSPPRYPLISINRRRQSYRPAGNFSIHRRRTVSWPTVSNDVDREDLGSVRVRNRPMGVNFHFDITFWCLRPDTQALFFQKAWHCFWRSGGVPQTWVPTLYPTEEGMLNVRMALEGDISDGTPDDPVQDQVKYQTNMAVRIEGWHMDMRDEVLPAFWTLITNFNLMVGDGEVNPYQLQTVYAQSIDLRSQCENPNILTRVTNPPVPSPGS